MFSKSIALTTLAFSSEEASPYGIANVSIALIMDCLNLFRLENELTFGWLVIHCHENILVDKPLMLHLVFKGISTAMDNSHLLDESGFAGFSCA
jgi:hypothetical protein